MGDVSWSVDVGTGGQERDLSWRKIWGAVNTHKGTKYSRVVYKMKECKTNHGNQQHLIEELITKDQVGD